MANFVTSRDVKEQRARIRLDDIRSQAAIEELQNYRLDAPVRQVAREQAQYALETLPQARQAAAVKNIDDQIEGAAEAGNYDQALTLLKNSGRVDPDAELVFDTHMGIPAVGVKSSRYPSPLWLGKDTRKLIQTTGAKVYLERQKPPTTPKEPTVVVTSPTKEETKSAKEAIKEAFGSDIADSDTAVNDYVISYKNALREGKSVQDAHRVAGETIRLGVTEEPGMLWGRNKKYVPGNAPSPTKTTESSSDEVTDDWVRQHATGVVDPEKGIQVMGETGRKGWVK